MSAAHARVAVASVLAGATALCAGLSAWAVALPNGRLGALAPVAYSHDARAALHMKALLSSDDLDEAERESRRVLALAPAMASPWVRLAYIESWRHRAVTPAAIADLTRSYEVSPLGPDVSPARIKFALEGWSGLPPRLRDLALADLEAFWRRRPEEAQALVQGVLDPQGRLVGGMSLADAQANAFLQRRQ